MANESLRAELRNKGLMLWQLADLLGISEASVTRMLRHELTPEKAASIMAKVNEEATDNG